MPGSATGLFAISPARSPPSSSIRVRADSSPTRPACFAFVTSRKPHVAWNKWAPTTIDNAAWPALDLQTFLVGVAAPARLPERSVLLTFDDGYRSMRQIALPWLLRFGYPSVLFVPTDFIGKCNEFDAGIEPQEAVCDWDDLRELQRHGVSVQSHGASHRRCSELAPGELEEELHRSKATLEAGLGTPVEAISYPYGDGGVDPQAVDAALERTGYRAACLYGGGPNRLPVANPYRLARLAIGPDTDLRAALEGKIQRRTS